MAQPLTVPLSDAPALIPTPALASRPAPKSPYLFSPLVDGVCLIFSPLLALLVGFLASRVPDSIDSITVFSKKASLLALLGTTMTQSHLVIVFFRSHGNRKVFSQFPLRFTIVPLLMFAAMMLKAWIFYFAFALNAIWDVYHSSMQVFGLARIYDTRAGVSAQHGRGLDIMMSHVLYVGPVLAGVNLSVTLGSLKEVNNVGSTLFDFIPAYASAHQWLLTEWVVAASLLYVAFYVVFQIRSARRGIPVSRQKVAMLVATAICSICAWGFNSFGKAFLIMNFFHAVQYFAIVWWAERETVKKAFRVPQFAYTNALALGLLVVAALSYGFWFAATGPLWANNDWVYRTVVSITSVVATMHFWYDGFVWSIRAKAIPA